MNDRSRETPEQKKIMEERDIRKLWVHGMASRRCRRKNKEEERIRINVIRGIFIS
jgi:hypothetical protein